MMPSMIWSAAFLLFPLGLVAWYSLTNWTGFQRPEFVGTKNYHQLAGDQFGSILSVTGIFAIGGAVASVSIGFVLAIFIRQRLRG